MSHLPSNFAPSTLDTYNIDRGHEWKGVDFDFTGHIPQGRAAGTLNVWEDKLILVSDLGTLLYEVYEMKSNPL